MAFYPMRRSAQALPEDLAWEVLCRGSFGVLAVAAKGEDPYAVPLSYCCQDGKIFIHCAREGHKMEILRQNARVSFCVVDQDRVVPQEYTTHYRSVIAFGRARILEEGAALSDALMALCRKYCPGQDETSAREIAGAMGRVAVIEIQVERVTGKEALPLSRQRQK